MGRPFGTPQPISMRLRQSWQVVFFDETQVTEENVLQVLGDGL